jgi:hypothetical protein
MNTTAARHIPACQKAGARRPDVVPSFLALSETRYFGLWRTARDDNKLLILWLEARVPRGVTSASSVSSADGREECRYRHVIGRVASKSRVSRNCRARRTADTTATMAGRRLRLPCPRSRGHPVVRDPVMLPMMVKGGGWAFGCSTGTGWLSRDTRVPHAVATCRNCRIPRFVRLREKHATCLMRTGGPVLSNPCCCERRSRHRAGSPPRRSCRWRNSESS